jgi:hypothetical protein
MLIELVGAADGLVPRGALHREGDVWNVPQPGIIASNLEHFIHPSAMSSHLYWCDGNLQGNQ